jgi:hypothetical protein
MSPVDNLWTTRRKAVQNPVDNLTYLTPVLPSSSASERLGACSSLRSLVVVGVLCLFLGADLLKMQPAQANEVDHYKLYAHSRIINYEQYKCLSHIIHKESRWNIKAINGSHYGLGQMRSKHYRNLDGYRQIDATIKYIKGRYGSMCKAWTFHKKHGYY